ncbi:MAG: transporter substrate-binding domain-containing protein [Acidobacteriota bacterium]
MRNPGVLSIVCVSFWGLSAAARPSTPPADPSTPGPLVIGLPAEAPFASGEPAEGFLVDLWRASADAADVDVTFRLGSDAEILGDIASGAVDIHGGWTLGGGDGGLELGWPVARHCHALLSVSAPLAWDRWRGERVAMTPAVARTELFASQDHRMLSVDSAASAVEALSNGEADLVVAPAHDAALVLQGLTRPVKQRPLHCPWMVSAAPTHRRQELVELRRGFESLQPATLRQFDTRWRAPSIPSLLAPRFEVSDAELRFLADRPSVVLGASDWVPMTERTTDGRWTGLGLETVRAVFLKTGVLPIFVGGREWSAVVDAATEGRTDGLGYSRADTRKERFLSFTQPLVSPGYIIATRIDAPFLRDLEDLQGARLAMIRHYAMRGWVEENHPQIELVPVADATDGLQRVADGSVAAYMDIEPAITAVSNRLGFTEVKLATRLQVSSDMAIGVRREWPELRSVLNRAIDATGEAERERIYRRWDRVSFVKPPSKREVWKAAAWLASPLVLLLGILGVRLLQHRRRAAEAKRQLRRQVLQLQKLEALGTLAKGVSHEFNNILQAILGYAEVAASPEDEGEHDMAISRIVDSADRARGVVEQILAFSHDQRLENRPVDLVALVKDVSRLLRASVPAKIGITLDIAVGPCYVLGEPVQLQQIIMNLATNAIEAMPSGGRLTLGLGPFADAAETQVTTGTLGDGPYWRLRVGDTGVGIEAEDLTRIFDPFFTTRELGESSGLGLAVVHGIVSAHGGGIRVVSSPGEGSCFEVFFPQARPAAVDGPATPAPAPEVDERKRRVLVVDDEAFLTDIVKRALARGGYRADVFNDSPEAFATFAQDPAAYDLILSDLNMPQLTGQQLAERAVELRPDIPIIVMTGYSSRVLSEPLAQGTIRQVLEKPVRPRDLLDAVSRQLSAGA